LREDHFCRKTVQYIFYHAGLLSAAVEGSKQMGSFSIWHWLVVLAVVIIIFGAGRLPTVMGDMAKGIKAFKNGMKDNNDNPTPPPTKPEA
jgi:TatA/E family protein of Tat protein translocase